MKYKIVVGENIISYSTTSKKLALNFAKRMHIKNPIYNISVMQLSKNKYPKRIKIY
jgi:hypothetical protein